MQMFCDFEGFPSKKQNALFGLVIFPMTRGVFRPIFCSLAPAALPALRLDWPPGNESDSAVDLDHDGNPVKKNATRRDQVNIAFGTGEARPVSDRKGGHGGCSDF